MAAIEEHPEEQGRSGEGASLEPQTTPVAGVEESSSRRPSAIAGEKYRPARRPLKIFAYDPVLGRVANNRITIDIANERLKRGPMGRKIDVIDYDSSTDTYYPPLDLDDPHILMRGGIDPSEGDVLFHQQMVYAVSMKVIENFERALGREIRFRRGRQLKVFPHAFRGANAFYDPETRSLFFGYFRADQENPGANLPKQWVFTCLSHDIVAHETTHAIVDKLRFKLRQPTNRDVLAFHEAIADIVAIFQHFTFPEVLRDVIRNTRADIRSPSPLIELAVQFGHGTGQGRALRSAVDGAKPDPSLYRTTFEPHDRGSILVAAVFDGFFKLYSARIQDLLRLATGGSGILEEGALHPDLVNRVAWEASSAADEVLRACLRAFEYLPVLDVDFGDFLRAMVTADYELNPVDRHSRRAAMIEAFGQRGIYPSGVSSLGEEALLWEGASELTRLPKLPSEVRDMVIPDLIAFDRRTQLTPNEFELGYKRHRRTAGEDFEDGVSISRREQIFDALYGYGMANAKELFLESDGLAVAGYNTTFRVGEDGKLRTELVIQWMNDTGADGELGGLKLAAGTTVVFSAEGVPRYVIPKPKPHPWLPEGLKKAAESRREATRQFVAESDSRDPDAAWADRNWWKNRMQIRYGFSGLHQGMGRPF